VVGASAEGPDAQRPGREVDADTPELFTDTSVSRADAAGSSGRSGSRGRRDGAARWSERPVPGDADGEDGRERSDEEWVSEGRSIMLQQLALGPRSRHQLGVKLAERDVPPSVADALLDRFEEVQLIDDAEFARMWVRTRTAAKALTRSSIRRELADKGVDPELAEDALLQISDEDEHDQARDVVRRRMRGSADLSDRAVRDKEVRRLVGVLARKGHSPGAAFTIVKDVMAETADEATG
jgi:SOS response regulatory protein OraA/RecX